MIADAAEAGAQPSEEIRSTGSSSVFMHRHGHNQPYAPREQVKEQEGKIKYVKEELQKEEEEFEVRYSSHLSDPIMS